MTKRICMVAYTHYRSDARPRREAQALVARGDTLDFVGLSHNATQSTTNVEGVQLIELPAMRYRGSSTLAYLRSYARFFAHALAWVTKHHLQQRYDVIHIHTIPDFMVFTASFAKLLGAKVVLDVHDTLPELYQSKFGFAPEHPLIRAIRLQERLSCAMANRVICVHEPHKDLLVQRGIPEGKISVLLNVPDPAVFGAPKEPAPRTQAPRLVYHGTVAERLGLDVALRAFAKTLATHADARFDIIGTGDYAGKTHELIKELSIGHAVQFFDRHFAVTEIPALIGDASVGLIPNRDDPATRMMLPVKLLEYVHLGIPAVAPRLPVIMHYFGDDALAYYTPGDVESFASAIARTLDDQNAALARGRRAAAFSARYQWETLKRDLYAVIDN